MKSYFFTFLSGLLVTLLLAPVETMVAEEMNGLLVFTHEVHTLRLCGSQDRRQHRAMKKEGTEISTMSQLAQWTVESEKVLVF